MAAPSPCGLEAPDHGSRHAVRLAHDELRRPGQLVRDGDLGGLELVAGGVAPAAQVEERGDPGDADRDVGGALPPGPAEGVADDHGDGAAGQLGQPVAERAGRGVGIDRQQDERAGLRRIRRVHARGCTHETVLRLRDHEALAGADDALRLAQDHLDVARVVLRRGELAGAFGRLDLVEPHDASLGLRDDLLRDDDHVAVLERCRGGDERAEIVPLAHLRQPLEREDPELAHSLISS